jgi:hypothetical protein
MEWPPMKTIKKPSDQYLSLIVMGNWLASVWIWIQEVSVVLPISYSCVENRVCLSPGVQVIGVTCRAATRIMAGVWDLVQRTSDSQAQVGYSVARRSRGWVTLCAVCTVHKEMRSVGFMVSKPRSTVSPDLASKPVDLGFPIWASKLTAMVWWFEPKNHCDSFLVWASKPSMLRFVGCATKPMGGWRQRGTCIKI